MQPDITWRNWLMVAALGLIWGSSFMVVEVALTGISPFWLAASRVTFGTLLTVVVWMISGRRFFLTEKNRVAQHRGHWCAQLGPPLFIA